MTMSYKRESITLDKNDRKTKKLAESRKPKAERQNVHIGLT